MRPRAGGGGATCFLLHGEEVWINGVLILCCCSFDTREFRWHIQAYFENTSQSILWSIRSRMWEISRGECKGLNRKCGRGGWNLLPLLSVGVLRLMSRRFWRQPVSSWRRKCPIVLDRLNAASTGPSVAGSRASPWRRRSAPSGSACTRRLFSWSVSGCPGSSSSRLWPSPVEDAREQSVTEMQKDIKTLSPLSSFTLYLARKPHS